MKRLIKIQLILLTLSIFFTACGQTPTSSLVRLKKNRSPQQVTLYLPNLPKTLDPRTAQTLADQTLVPMLMEGLMRLDQRGACTPALAEKVDLSSDGRTYRFTLRPSKWSNGDCVTSYDFAYAWKKSLSPDFNSPCASALYALENAEEAKMGKLPLSLVGIETPNEKTLIVTLKTPTASFLHSLSHPIFFPVNRRVDKKNPNWAHSQTTYVGNGPFLLNGWRSQNGLEVEKNETYWDEHAVKLTTVDILKTHLEEKTLTPCSQTGSETPTPNRPILSLENKRGLNLCMFPKEWIVLNEENPPLQNKNFRKALACAITPEMPVDPTRQAEAPLPVNLVSPSLTPHPSTPIRLDQERIDRLHVLFNSALFELGLPFNDLPSLSLLYPSCETNDLLAQTLHNEWKNLLGIEINLEGVEEQEFFDRISKKEYFLFLGNWNTGFKDPTSSLKLFETDTTAPSHSNAGLIPLSHFKLFDSKDRKLKGVLLTESGALDFKWAHLD